MKSSDGVDDGSISPDRPLAGTVATARALTEDEEAGLRELIGTRLGHGFALRFVYVDEIPRLPSGKYEDFRSEITAPRAGAR